MNLIYVVEKMFADAIMLKFNLNPFLEVVSPIIFNDWKKMSSRVYLCVRWGVQPYFGFEKGGTP